VGAASVPRVDTDDLAELRQHVADLAELTAAMQWREKLERDSPEWKAAVEFEERLIARIQWGAARQKLPPSER
jgi:hypothetical protein